MYPLVTAVNPCLGTTPDSPLGITTNRAGGSTTDKSTGASEYHRERECWQALSLILVAIKHDCSGSTSTHADFVGALDSGTQTSKRTSTSKPSQTASIQWPRTRPRGKWQFPDPAHQSCLYRRKTSFFYCKGSSNLLPLPRPMSFQVAMSANSTTARCLGQNRQRGM